MNSVTALELVAAPVLWMSSVLGGSMSVLIWPTEDACRLINGGSASASDIAELTADIVGFVGAGVSCGDE